MKFQGIDVEVGDVIQVKLEDNHIWKWVYADVFPGRVIAIDEDWGDVIAVEHAETGEDYVAISPREGFQAHVSKGE